MFNTKFSFKNKNITALIVFLVFSLFPFLAAANLVPCGGPGQDPCQFCHLFVLIDNIISYFLGNIVTPIALLMIVLGGFYMIISSGNPEEFQKAKSFVTAVVMGMAIIFVALAFLYTFFDIIGVAEWTELKGWRLTDWWEIICP